MSTVFTIGHSTRALDEFIALLQAHGVETLVDVRRFPASRRHPHFNGEALAASLRAAGIEYVHEEALGGRRPALADSQNAGWREKGFRGYADYTATPEFGAALARLQSHATARRVCIMCAEAVPWRCHRRLIADALVARGVRVQHILSAERADAHELPEFARLQDDGHVVYPADGVAQQSLF